MYSFRLTVPSTSVSAEFPHRGVWLATLLGLAMSVGHASETFSPPQKWAGVTDGTTDGNATAANGHALWRLDQVRPCGELDDLEEPDNYRPFAWNDGRWYNAEGSLDGQPWAQVDEKGISFGLRGRHTTPTYWINRDSEYAFRFGALVFVAPYDGTFSFTTTVDIERKRDDHQISLSVYTKETSLKGQPFIRHIKDFSAQCTWWGRVPLASNQNIISRALTMKKGNELILSPCIEGDNPIGTAWFCNTVVSGDARVQSAEVAPKRLDSQTLSAAASSRRGDIVFPRCVEKIDETMEFWGGYRGLHAGHACAQVIDITQPPYNADHTGKVDVSAIVTRALLENRNSNRVIYLPNGTYMVSDTIKMREDGGNVGPCLQGQSRTGTILRLKDGTWPTAGADLHAVLKTGGGKPENFQRIVRNFTISIGKNNDGASGMYFYGNNQSSMSDVTIMSEDGKGQIGLDLDAGSSDQGPCLVQNTSIKGFKIGIKGSPLSSVTMRNITIEGQSEVGLSHSEHGLFVDGLTSMNKVPAISCGNGFLLINANLKGGARGVPAIRHKGGQMFLRHVAWDGYAQAIETPQVAGVTVPNTPMIEEFSTQKRQSLFEGSQHSLNLPVKDIPEPTWESDLGKWASVDSYRIPGRTDAEALQAAIDDPAISTVCVPSRLRINREESVIMRGNVSRIIGTGGLLIGEGNLVVGEDGPAVVKIERMNVGKITQRSKRTVVIEAVTGHVIHEGAGDVFMVDVCSTVEVNHPLAHMWMWQYNAEGHNNDDLVVRAGTVRVFGWKTEAWGTKLVATGGTVEIIGFKAYCGPLDKSIWPLFDISNTRCSFAGVTQTTFSNGCYRRLVKETNNGVERELTTEGNPSGDNLDLFTSGDSAGPRKSEKNGRK